jgi:regulatory protein
LEEDKKDAPGPFAVALQRLARRPYSVAEMRRTLRRKFDEEAAVKDAIARLHQLGLLDDRKFSQQYASFLARHRGFGRERIRRELRLKRVDEQAIEAALAQTFEEVSEQQILERALEKKLRNVHLPLTIPKFYSLCQSLKRLGFRSDDIMKTMRSRPELQPKGTTDLHDEL